MISSNLNRALLLVLCALMLSFTGCGGASNEVRAAGPGIAGVYENTQANASVEFLSGGKAHLTLSGVGTECTYKVQGDELTLNLDGEVTVFQIEADGSLTGPPDTFLSRLKKK